MIIMKITVLKTHHDMPCNYASKSNIFRSLVIEEKLRMEKK